MSLVRIDSSRITDWPSFHETCKEAFDFPSFYGMNLSAFVDCLTYIDEGDGMSNIVLEPGEMLTIELLSADDFQSRVPEIFNGLIDSVQAINRRFTDETKPERVRLVLL